MTQINTLIFDLDGTLVHSAPDIHAAANVAMQKMGRETFDLPTIISFIGNGVGVLTEHCLNATGGSDPETLKTATAHVLDAYQSKMTTLTQPYDGVIAALQTFKDQGMAMGICTNKPQQPALDLCDALGLTRFFDVISGVQDGKPRKPDAAPLLACIADLGATPATTQYIGDSSVDYETARNADVKFRLFNGGYLNHPLPDLAETDRFDSWSAHGISAC